MNNKIVPIIIGLVIVIGVGGVTMYQSKPASTGTPTPTDVTPGTGTPTGTTTGTPVVKEKTYVLADISTHKDATSCWSAVNGGVYDLTSWISQHPGGEGAILSICGKDGSGPFNSQHGGRQKQADILKTFKIGMLTQ